MAKSTRTLRAAKAPRPKTQAQIRKAKPSTARTAMPRGKSAPVVGVVILPHATGLELPAYQTALSAGMDLLAALPDDKPLKLKPRDRALLPTGLILELPEGYEAQIRPRSGLALRDGLTVLNAPGTIDADYRGEIQVLLINFGGKPLVLRRGDRIAQLVVAPVTQVQLRRVRAATTTQRGTGGFGSTGVRAIQAASKQRQSASRAAQKARTSATNRRSQRAS